MNILVCPDKFKGSLSAREVCTSVAEALRELNAESVIATVPLADGGEGTCELLTESSGGSMIEVEVHGPLFNPLTARYGISGDGNTAFIEMAAASGLTLLRPEQRNPLFTTTLGTGEMIADALNRNVRQITLGIGGSATNDAGIGMATALGYEFLDAQREPLTPTGENLIHIRYIMTDKVDPRLKSLPVIALCDVTNPLCGPEGAAYVYAPQKVADKRTVELLDAGLRNFRRVVHKEIGKSVDFPGAGAAGGLGAGTRVFLNASMVRGVSYMVQHTNLHEKIQWADLIITGEGKIDNQTFSGKVVSEVVTLARDAGKSVVAICGKCELAENTWKADGLAKVISLVDRNTTEESAVENAARHLKQKIAAELKDLSSLLK